MSSDDFERRLHRMFADTPALPDEPLFNAQVRHKLDQGQTIRRLVIGAVGGLGAAVATVQVLSANVGGRLTQGGADSVEALELGWSALSREAGGLLGAAPLPGELMWTAAGLVALAVAFLTTRMTDAY